jgi:hypothetical protein
MGTLPHKSVVAIGLPSSGKTTYLAALWHTICDHELATKLSFLSLRSGDTAYLNAIAKRWRNAKLQERTFISGSRLVSINLKDQSNTPLVATFPDIAGETFSNMWEKRECDFKEAEYLRGGGLLLFIHADHIKAPKWVVDMTALAKELGVEIPADGNIPWHPKYAPTQVKIVSLLSLLREEPLDTGPRRLAVMLSAWDKVRDEGLTPDKFIEEKLPLLHQYLRQDADKWEWRAYGVSAQGGDYDKLDPENPQAPASAEAESLLDLGSPSTRIQLVSGKTESHDLTEPLEWLIS